jgi:ABC-2 type transport system ATP-binding protein
VIAEGTPTKLKADLGATVLEVGLHNHDDAQRAVTVLTQVGSHAPNANGTVVEVTVDNGPEAAMEALRALDQQGVTPTAFTLREPSLDDVFLALTGRRAEEEHPDDPSTNTNAKTPTTPPDQRGGMPAEKINAGGRP